MIAKSTAILLDIIANPRPHPLKMQALDAVWCGAYNRLFDVLPRRERRLIEFGSETLPVVGRPMSYRRRVAEVRRRIEAGEIELSLSHGCGEWRGPRRVAPVHHLAGTFARAAEQRRRAKA